MDVREKLVELLCSNSLHRDGVTMYDVADHLIAHGVTVQEWISVKDRLPEERVAVLCIGSRGGMFVSNCWRISNTAPGGKIWINGQGWRTFTHWAHLPQPPKGE